MPNPRLTTDYADIGRVDVAYRIDASTILFDRTLANGSAQAGLAVGLKAAVQNIVELVADAQAVLGQLLRVEPDGVCVVRVGGYAQLPGGLSASLTRGNKIVGALGTASARGYIRDAVAAESPKAGHLISDPTTTTAVWVLLGD